MTLRSNRKRRREGHGNGGEREAIKGGIERTHHSNQRMGGLYFER
jgi:hypothetical protein